MIDLNAHRWLKQLNYKYDFSKKELNRVQLQQIGEAQKADSTFLPSLVGLITEVNSPHDYVQIANNLLGAIFSVQRPADKTSVPPTGFTRETWMNVVVGLHASLWFNLPSLYIPVEDWGDYIRDCQSSIAKLLRLGADAQESKKVYEQMLTIKNQKADQLCKMNRDYSIRINNEYRDPTQ